MDDDFDTPRHIAAVVEDGLLTLPPSIRAHMGVAPGDHVYFHPDLLGGMVVRKVGTGPLVERFSSMRGVAGPGPTTDEVMQMTRGAFDA